MINNNNQKMNKQREKHKVSKYQLKIYFKFIQNI